MTFIKYTNDGKAVIQPAALILSGLENEVALEMQTLDNVLVLHKEKMPPVEKMKTVISLMRLVNSLTSDTMCGFEEHIDEECDDECDDDFDDDFDEDDNIPIPVEAFEDAGILGKILHVQVSDGAVLITAAEENDESNEMKEHALAQLLFQAAVSLNAAVDLLKQGDPDA
jgi:HSP20 family molecular chaperone IbpA